MSNKLATRKAANDYAELAMKLEEIGLFMEANYGFEAAAELDLMDDELQNGWGGPLNGQKKRIECFEKIIDLWRPQTIVETGSFRGISTQWFSDNSNAGIYSCEKNKRYFLQAKKKLSNNKNINLAFQDSIYFLKDLADSETKKDRCLFYLDAHWEEELPLREELEIIEAEFSNSIIIIDDFKVPYDAGYGYDNYGPGKTLSLAILEGIIDLNRLIGFPKENSLEETGARRGYAVLLPKIPPDLVAFGRLITIDTVRGFKEIEASFSDQFHQAEVDALKERIRLLEYHCAERMNQINLLSKMINNKNK